jgi:sialate O-acetylesterase
MMRRLHLAGGKARGILWFQGEADARDPKAAPLYGAKLRELIAAARNDSGIADLGFYLVQIGRMLEWPYYGVDGRTPPPTLDRQFAEVREAQRRIGIEIDHAGTVASIDLSLRDGIHLATPDLKRVGRRLANIVGSARGPRLDRVIHDSGAERIYVRFSDVTGGFDPNTRIAGFTLRTAAGAEIASIYRAAVDPQQPGTIVLSYQGKLPERARLVYGWGANPYCNLVDHADMAAPCFGPVALDYASE